MPIPRKRTICVSRLDLKFVKRDTKQQIVWKAGRIQYQGFDRKSTTQSLNTWSHAISNVWNSFL